MLTADLEKIYIALATSIHSIQYPVPTSRFFPRCITAPNRGAVFLVAESHGAVRFDFRTRGSYGTVRQKPVENARHCCTCTCTKQKRTFKALKAFSRLLYIPGIFLIFGRVGLSCSIRTDFNYTADVLHNFIILRTAPNRTSPREKDAPRKALYTCTAAVVMCFIFEQFRLQAYLIPGAWCVCCRMFTPLLRV